MAARHEVPQIYWGLQPANLPTPASDFGICPPAPAPTHSGTQTVWQTALFPAAQAAVLQSVSVDWPEIWGCSVSHGNNHSALNPDCEMNGRCVAVDNQTTLVSSPGRQFGSHSDRGYCLCEPGWRGPTCASLKLGATPRMSGFRHENHSSWGGSIVKDPPLTDAKGERVAATRDQKHLCQQRYLTVSGLTNVFGYVMEIHGCAGCIVNTDSPGQWSMFSSFMLGDCGLNDWNINSEIVRAVASDPVGPYKMVERVAGPFVSDVWCNNADM